MKKLLALVLALVMSLSLVTISNADFADADQIDLTEAVEVLNAVGVLEGDGKNFNPKAELTREQAAKIIAYLALGKDVAEALPAVKVFNDVEADRWSAKFIAYCADAGYLAGVGNGNFDPAGKLTGYAFGKMLLCALGYDAKIEEFTGNNWQIKVSSLMSKNDIAKGVDKNGSAVLTREEAAQYALNALKAICVEYENKGSTIIAGDVTVIGSASKASKVENAGSTDVIVKDGFMQLGEQLYNGKLSLDTTTKDDFGRKTNTWEYKDFKEAYVSGEADYVYYGTVSGKTLYNDLGLDSKTEYTVNGTKMTGKTIKELKDDFGALNCIVEVDFDKDAKAITVREIKYYCGEVTGVKAAKGDDARTITIDKSSKYTYETEAFEKGDIVLYTYENSKVQSVQLAESVEGKVSAVKGSKLTINGVSYKFLSTIDDDAKKPGAEGTFYLGVDNSIVKVTDLVAVVSAEDFMYVYSVYTPTEGTVNADGYVTKQSTAYYVLADGTKGSAKIDKDYESKIAKETVIPYSLNKDGELELATADADVKLSAENAKAEFNSVDVSKALVDGFYANASTKYVFINVNDDDAKVSTSVTTGYKNVAEQTAPAYVVADKDGKALTVFVIAKAKGASTDATYAYLLDKAYTLTKDSDDEDLYTYDVLINGELDTISADKDGKAKLEALKLTVGQCFTYTLKDGVLDTISTNKDLGVAYVGSEKVDFVGEDYIVVAGKDYALEADAAIYLLDADAEEIEDVLTADALEENDEVIIYTNGETDPDDVKYIAVVITKEAE